MTRAELDTAKVWQGAPLPFSVEEDTWLVLQGPPTQTGKIDPGEATHTRKAGQEVADALKPLTRRNRRQKSDVAQKLVSMCLHELSAALVLERPDLRVETASYIEAVRAVFGGSCAFCARPLGTDTHVEHLDAMNRLRAGLHVAGNVVLACKPCNNAKRNDDQRCTAGKGRSGWDSFLLHDGSHCPPGCPTCKYWASVTPSSEDRGQFLASRLELIRSFRARYDADDRLRCSGQFAERLEAIYREWQVKAAEEAMKFAAEAMPRLTAAPEPSG
jgi:5-methylcytosine-specific restriction endonuclease McrA